MIYERWAEDDIDALNVANAVEDEKGEVICISSNGQRTSIGAMAPHTMYVVWFRVKDDAHGRQIDKRIEKVREK